MYERDQAWLLREKYGGVQSPEYFNDLKRIESGEHIAYVIGWVPFLGCRIDLESRPLIPRPETEWWTEQVLLHLKTLPHASIACLDLFSGSGCIGVALLTHESRTKVDFGEIEPQHLSTIKKNIARNGIDVARTRVIQTDIFSQISGRYDIITANPPYIDAAKRARLDSELGIEPATALYAQEEGIEYIRRFIEKLPEHLTEKGKAFIEFDSGQEQRIESIAAGAGIRTTFFNDQYGVPRFLMAE